MAGALHLRCAGCLSADVAPGHPESSDFVYRSAGAGLGAFVTGLGDALRGSGVHGVDARPGFVRTRRTARLPAAFPSTARGAVAEAVVAGVRWRRDMVRVPGALCPAAIAPQYTPRSHLGLLPW